MRLALVGDIHAYRLFVPPWRLVGKALVGQTNLWLNRRRHFHRHLLRPTLQHVAEVAPDMLLLSGDLTTTAVGAEFHDVALALNEALSHVPTVIVPGNHDRYTLRSLRKRRIETVFPKRVPAPFPHVRALGGGWQLLALDASVPRAWTSRGKLGVEQLHATEQFLADLPPDAGVVVLCHYPFAVPPELPPMKWHHMLSDAESLRNMLKNCRARVIFMHGHVHLPWRWQPIDLPHVTDMNAGAPCLVSASYPQGQGFWQIDLPDDPRQPFESVHHLMQQGQWLARQVV